MANNNKPMVDLPFFELCNQALVPTTSMASMCTDGRYIYYISYSTVWNFYKYDTIGDTWQVLATPITTPVSWCSLVHIKDVGVVGDVLSATANTVTINNSYGKTLDGETLRITVGPGGAQDRVLTFVSDNVHDFGTISTGSTNYITDSSKKWEYNQWAGYSLVITQGSGATQIKTILYNDTTNLYIADTNLIQYNHWTNTLYSANTPYVVPVGTANATKSEYQIVSSTYSVSAWTTIPTSSSKFTTLTGGVYLFTGVSTAPYITNQYYNIVQDTWQIKSVPRNVMFTTTTSTAVVATQRLAAPYLTNALDGYATAMPYSWDDDTQSMTPDRWVNHRIIFKTGSAAGHSYRITGNTDTTFYVERNWDVIPTDDSQYEVWPDYDLIYFTFSTFGSIITYSISTDTWTAGPRFSLGNVNNTLATVDGVGYGVTSGTRIASGVVSINPVPTAAGTNYVVGDILTIAGGFGNTVIVTSIGTSGAVTGLAIVNSGSSTGATVGTGKATTGGSGTGCTVEITAVGPTANIATRVSAPFRRGQTVTISGMTDSAWNTSYTILGVSAVTTSSITFSIAITAAANAAATLNQSSTVVVDVSKNWTVNELVGKVASIMVAGLIPTVQSRWIVSNTANSFTIGNSAITAAVDGTSRYVIYDAKLHGVDDQYPQVSQQGYGRATSGTTTTLVDTSKSWVTNQWANYLFKVEAGTGYGSGMITITSNTADTLTFATQTFTVDSTTKYAIADTWGKATAGSGASITDTNKKWSSNQFIGQRLLLVGAVNFYESVVTSNTATIVNQAQSVETGTVYGIFGSRERGTNTGLIWNSGSTNASTSGRYILNIRGGDTGFIEIYDIPTQKYVTNIPITLRGELFGLGSSYAYDGVDTVYLTRSATNGPIRVLKLNVNDLALTGAMTTAFTQGTITVGNFLEVIKDPTNTYSYVYVLQNTGSLMARSLIF